MKEHSHCVNRPYEDRSGEYRNIDLYADKIAELIRETEKALRKIQGFESPEKLTEALAKIRQSLGHISEDNRILIHNHHVFQTTGSDPKIATATQRR